MNYLIERYVTGREFTASGGTVLTLTCGHTNYSPYKNTRDLKILCLTCSEAVEKKANRKAVK